MEKDIEAQIKHQQDERKLKELEFKNKGHVAMVGDIGYDKDIYGDADRSSYADSIPLDIEDDDDGLIDHSINPFEVDKSKSSVIADREGEYRARRFKRELSPERADPFAQNNGQSQEKHARTYQEVYHESEVNREHEELTRLYAQKVQENQDNANQEASSGKSRWDKEEPAQPVDETPRNVGQWDETPRHYSSEDSDTRKSNRWDQTPVPSSGRSRWDQTPVGGHTEAETPRRSRSRWDETPVAQPVVSNVSSTPKPMNIANMTPEALNALRWEKDIEYRNRYLSDEELDQMLPSTGFKILDVPAGYIAIRTPARKLMATPTPLAGSGFMIPDEEIFAAQTPELPTEVPGVGQLPFFKQEDMQFFGKLMDNKDEESLSVEELKERKIMRLLLKIKNGNPQMRKSALRHITDKARDFGAKALFDQILPLLMSPTLEDQERHLLVKVIDRVLYKLDDLVRPYVHKILVVIEPLLIEEDYYARVEGREIISNLSKAAGLATMIATMRPDIDHVDEYVRNTTARAFSVVASALGIPALMPFLKAVCRSKKSWQARHTGIKIVQQIAILMGCAVLPHLRNLVDIIHLGLEDEQQKVRTITALCLAALAEASAPYGIESFDDVLKPLWTGIRKHRGKSLAAFLKAIGYIIPLMDAGYASYYTTEVMVILIREFQSPDEEMKKIVLKVVKQCAATDGVQPGYIKEEILPEFFRHFWVRRMALDRRNYKQVVETTVELAQKVGTNEIVSRIVDGLKDESEPYRKMVMECIDAVVTQLGVADVDPQLEERLVDGILYAFQEQIVEDVVMLNGFGAVFNALGLRAKPYLSQAVSNLLWRLNNQSAKVRQQAADLVSRIAVVLRTCGEEALLSNLGKVLYEYLGEEFPEVLGSILAALKSIVNVIGMTNMNPPISELLPRLTPILKNRHEKVQENCIDLVGRIADRGAEAVSAREWMRICFELLDMLKAHKKGIRRATVNTFGYIAKAIGPQDVLATLLNNLKVQERQNRVCTTVAIAIVAETCAPFTVLPALMNEYRVPELNVQNGVLKSLSFLFEYIGEMGKDYIYAVTPILEDALMDRDLVHRQTACTTVKHIALGVAGLGCEDALLHLLNFVWPNIFETSPHVINSFIEAIEGLRVALGPGKIMQYLLQGLFHPARKVREIYWKLYNNIYIASPDALTMFYPNIESSNPQNDYKRYEIDYVI
ncbi:ARM repeat-containing protein [Conidiobolus coronatus NRRL 28638]|uniref:ARM repeat-containing protein n=1 Tax=Conidiobolus coronatus (strain ATCC 28846 / CBS 209.66 / NRRL 28638) TaxID=796925 RepID=A0A137PHN6_CONC2|nr:ARM repeat-containing protein [Conidiobolus coronatus NRRL 28638]|eukprot:KXN74492.1 ARM repeat-containing protein [Conidiobolus coronatus NRRL 28638]